MVDGTHVVDFLVDGVRLPYPVQVSANHGARAVVFFAAAANQRGNILVGSEEVPVDCEAKRKGSSPEEAVSSIPKYDRYRQREPAECGECDQRIVQSRSARCALKPNSLRSGAG